MKTLATPLLLLALVAVGLYVHGSSFGRPVALENSEDVSFICVVQDRQLKSPCVVS